jgi:tetratricopeptide (TPR) repeat protein
MFAVEKGLEPMILEWFETHLRNAPTTPSAQTSAQMPTTTEEFWTALTKGEIARARKLYEDTTKRDPKTVLFPEAELNLHGYQLLQDGEPADAVEVFRLNVEAYPASANTYDSLSDGYLAAGKPADALRNAEKALELLATDTQVSDDLRAAIRESAEKKIRDLKICDIDTGRHFARDLSAPLRRIEGGKHFTPEDHPDIIAHEVQWLMQSVGSFN